MAVTKLTERRYNCLRLQGYDYSQNGAYFVTMVTKNRESLFGDIVAKMMMVNDVGRAMQNVRENLPRHYATIALDDFVVMPNHIHGIVWIQINLLPKMHNVMAWQGSYHDSIIRSETELNQYRQYIQTNPLCWRLDKENWAL